MAAGWDTLIVGSGPIGALLAHRLAGAGMRVLVVEAGTGRADHRLDDPDLQRDPTRWHDVMRSLLVPASVSNRDAAALGGSVVAPNALQDPRTNLPAAATCEAVGGMGILWSCLAPRLELHERWPALTAREWDGLYDRSEAAFGVSHDALAKLPLQRDVLARIAAALPSRAVTHAPIAATLDRERRLWRFFAPEALLHECPGPGSIEVLDQHVVRRLVLRNGRAVGALVVDARKETRELFADTVIVACGAIRTPQLLFASGIHDDDASALGRYLGDHPLAYAQVVLDEDVAADAPPEPRPGVLVTVKPSSAHGFRGFAMHAGHPPRSSMAGEGAPLHRLLSLFWYMGVEPRPERRVRFDANALDIHGLPRPTFDYALSREERDRAKDMVAELGAVAKGLGAPLRSAPPQLLPAGSSMHVMGTTRMGTSSSTSVVDDVGRVWGVANLYVAGTGVVPVTTCTNPTLTAAALALRTSDSLLARGAA